MIAEAVAAGLAFICTPTHVWDGDGPIWCAEGPKIRLAGIAAREMDGSCKPGHPCPNSDARGARDYLASLLGRRTGIAPTGHVKVTGSALSCISYGSGKGDRTAASCSSPRVGDLGCAMLRSGYAVRWQRYVRGKPCR